MDRIKVFTAKKIITMNDPMPQATAVAVRDGRILEVGSLETLRPWLDVFPHEIDRTFEDKVLMPGFIDPHLHPTMAAVLLPMKFVTAMEWRLPWETVPPVQSEAAFLARLSDLDKSMPEEEPLFAWGYHQLWHGKIRRPALNGVSQTRPIIVWHRSFHEVILNDAALKWLEIDEEVAGKNPQIDMVGGHFFEMGLRTAVGKLNPHILSPERYKHGLERLREAVHFGGHTTIGDMATGMFELEMEWAGTTRVLDNDETPFRVQCIPAGNILGLTQGSHEKALELIQGLPERNTHRFKFNDHVKLFTDGAFFSQLMQLGQPGYIDGHHGEWLMVPETFEEAARTYWNAGYRIHVHCTGDLGVELALDVLQKLQEEKPRFDHRYTIEHFGLSTPEQTRRMATLGALASVNVYYFYELSDMYTREGLGHERASQMARLGSLANAGVVTALHSDFTMAPALPLNSAWVAANRINVAGNVLAPEERITLHQALRAITIDAAYVLGLENEVGSIRAGKMADFTVLERDPYDTPVGELKDINLWGTVFEGTPFPLKRY